MRKRIIYLLVVCLVAGIAYLFYQYQTISQQAEQQVTTDIKLIEQPFRNGSSHWLQTEAHKNKTLLKTQLITQSVDDQNRFIRHYHSKFIRAGEHSCLKTQIVYPQREAEVLEQSFVDTEACLP
ncbi:hypothetical protein HF888_01245 [Bermanella marisrubri]|uniref:Uncharacterized protein n=1 Tax=Bermanella marisrubri TaxID=207949 RepID=Q1N4D6_9GAMM|nr:hypothetical protein [Bermanella marisrubri]EAT12929.1 hypothetical protein RED65_14572 [Oceanobacter sp. RED65] [Bermanella marisrubri]QIZ82940.1 hypothetical protein HF888_01245 [Bermanella marisrubri]